MIFADAVAVVTWLSMMVASGSTDMTSWNKLYAEWDRVVEAAHCPASVSRIRPDGTVLKPEDIRAFLRCAQAAK